MARTWAKTETTSLPIVTGLSQKKETGEHGVCVGGGRASDPFQLCVRSPETTHKYMDGCHEHLPTILTPSWYIPAIPHTIDHALCVPDVDQCSRCRGWPCTTPPSPVTSTKGKASAHHFPRVFWVSLKIDALLGKMFLSRSRRKIRQ